MFVFLSNDSDTPFRRMCCLRAYRTVSRTPKSKRKSLAQCLGFYPMTLTGLFRRMRCLTVYRYPVKHSKIRLQVIGTMFGFLPKDLRQRCGERHPTSGLPMIREGTAIDSHQPTFQPDLVFGTSNSTCAGPLFRSWPAAVDRYCRPILRNSDHSGEEGRHSIVVLFSQSGVGMA
jgi:hypothetical protein